jgi:hypothetical protein
VSIDANDHTRKMVMNPTTIPADKAMIVDEVRELSFTSGALVDCGGSEVLGLVVVAVVELAVVGATCMPKEFGRVTVVPTYLLTVLQRD